MAPTGTIRQIVDSTFVWQIPGFYQLIKKQDLGIHSPDFMFRGTSWDLAMYKTAKGGAHFTNFSLWRKSYSIVRHRLEVNYRLYIKEHEKNKYWWSVVVSNAFDFDKREGTPQSLRDVDILKYIYLNTPTDVFSVYVTFDSAETTLMRKDSLRLPRRASFIENVIKRRGSFSLFANDDQDSKSPTHSSQDRPNRLGRVYSASFSSHDRQQELKEGLQRRGSSQTTEETEKYCSSNRYFNNPITHNDNDVVLSMATSKNASKELVTRDMFFLSEEETFKKENNCLEMLQSREGGGVDEKKLKPEGSSSDVESTLSFQQENVDFFSYNPNEDQPLNFDAIISSINSLTLASETKSPINSTGKAPKKDESVIHICSTSQPLLFDKSDTSCFGSQENECPLNFPISKSSFPSSCYKLDFSNNSPLEKSSMHSGNSPTDPINFNFPLKEKSSNSSIEKFAASAILPQNASNNKHFFQSTTDKLSLQSSTSPVSSTESRTTRNKIQEVRLNSESAVNSTNVLDPRKESFDYFVAKPATHALLAPDLITTVHSLQPATNELHELSSKPSTFPMSSTESKIVSDSSRSSSKQTLVPNKEYFDLFCEKTSSSDLALESTAVKTLSSECGKPCATSKDDLWDVMDFEAYLDAMDIQPSSDGYQTNKSIPCTKLLPPSDTQQKNLSRGRSTFEDSDFDPYVFQEFLQYFDTGDQHIIEKDNVMELYRIARKYEVHDLVHSCVDFMVANLSTDLFCNLASLAFEYSDPDLLMAANDYFAKNMADVVVGRPWRRYMTEHPVDANKLLVAAVSKKKMSSLTASLISRNNVLKKERVAK